MAKKNAQGNYRAYTPEQMIAALKASRGLLSPAARALGCGVNTIKKYMAEYPEIASAKDEAKYELHDSIELTIAAMALGERDASGKKWVREPNISALIFLAKTQLKDRGYNERIDHVISGVTPELARRIERAAQELQMQPGDLLEMLVQEIHAGRENSYSEDPTAGAGAT